MILLTENDINYFDSTNVLFSHYDQFNRRLFICFQGGQTYKYTNISIELNKSFLEANSQGKFINENIKDKYHFVKDKKYTKFEMDLVMSAVNKMKKQQLNEKK